MGKGALTLQFAAVHLDAISTALRALSPARYPVPRRWRSCDMSDSHPPLRRSARLLRLKRAQAWLRSSRLRCTLRTEKVPRLLFRYGDKVCISHRLQRYVHAIPMCASFLLGAIPS